MLKLVIVDDDKIFLNNIYRCVTDYSCLTNIEFDITLYDNSKALNDDIWKKTAYDIYLLDVEIPEMDGFKLAQKIQEYHKTALIIFISSHVEYAVLGYEYSIFRYICKINLEEKLPGALSEAVKRLAVNSNCYPQLTRGNTPQVMIFTVFAALSLGGVRPVRLLRLPCKYSEYQ